MKIVYMLSRLNYGGAEVRSLELFKALRNDMRTDKLVVYVYVYSGERGVLDDEYLKAGVKLRYGRPGLMGLVRFLSDVMRLAPDVLHVNANFASGFYCLIGWVCGVKVRIAHIRTSSNEIKSKLFQVKQNIYKFFMNIFATKVVGVSRSAIAYAESCGAKSSVIYNGVSIPRSISAPSKFTGKLLFVGRMNPAKNIAFLPLVVSSLIRRYPEINWTVDFYGKYDQIEYAKLEKNCIERGVLNRFTFYESTDTPQSTMMGYDCLLLPSIREGLPGVILEATSVGLPSLSSPVEGSIEIKEYGAVDYLNIETLDADTWADRIYSLAALKRQIKPPEEFIARFSFDGHVNEIKNLWMLGNK